MTNPSLPSISSVSAFAARLFSAIRRPCSVRKTKQKQPHRSTGWRIGSLLLSASALLYSMHAGTATQSQIDTAWNKGLSWLVTQQTGEGRWNSAPGTEVITSALAVESFIRAGVLGEAYSRAVSYTANTGAYSADARARQAIALYDAGMDASAAVTALIGARNSNLIWGAYPGYAGSSPDTPLALDAIKITGASYSDAAAGLNYIVNSQNTDGGWSHVNSASSGNPLPNPSAIIPTAHNLITLARYAGSPTNIGNGLAWLRSKQKSDGSFGVSSAVTGTIYETAMAYAAIIAAAPSTDTASVTAAASALTYLINVQRSDGSWAGDAFQTALVLQVLPTPSATPVITQDPNAIPGNGLNTSGPAALTNLGTVLTARSLSFSLSASGGTPPYAWRIIAGALPPGVTLTSTGLISGTAATNGNFFFTVQVTDASGAVVSTSTYEIDVIPALLSPELMDYLLDESSGS